MTKIEEFKKPFKDFEKIVFEIEGKEYLGEVEHTFVQHNNDYIHYLSDIKVSIYSDGVQFIRSINEVRKYEE